MKRLVIVGAGIGGLSTAYFALEKAKEKGYSLTVLLLEGRARIGGCILTEKIDGFVIEGGPDCFLYEKPWALELCERIGLGDRILNTNENRKVYIYSGGKLHELPEGFILMVPTSFWPFFKTSLISFWGKIRMAMEVFVPKRKPNGEESLAEFVTRRLGREALEKIAEPLVAGIHAGTPETMGLKSTFPRFLQMEQQYGSLIRGMMARRKASSQWSERKGPRRTMFLTLMGGLQECIDRLGERIGQESIHLNKEVLALRPAREGKFRLEVSSGRDYEADAVVFSTPSYVTAKIVQPFDPELSEMLLTIPYVSSAIVTLAYRISDIPRPLDAFGFVIPRTEKRRIMASTWTSVKFEHRAPRDMALLRVFVGGANNENLAYLEADEMVKMVREELRDIMGISADPLLTRIYRWEKSMPQYLVGHLEKVSRIEERLRKHGGLFVTGCAYRGIGISDTVHDAEVTAERAIEYLFHTFKGNK